MTALAEGRAASKTLAAEIAGLTERVRELDTELHDVLGHPDQADELDSLRATVTGKRGLGAMARLTALTAELTTVQRQLAEAEARRELHAEASPRNAASAPASTPPRCCRSIGRLRAA
jgi:hypothetical protein